MALNPRSYNKSAISLSRQDVLLHPLADIVHSGQCCTPNPAVSDSSDSRNRTISIVILVALAHGS